MWMQPPAIQAPQASPDGVSAHRTPELLRQSESEAAILEWAKQGWTNDATAQTFQSDGSWLVVSQTWGSGVTYTTLLVYYRDDSRKLWDLQWVKLDYFGFLKVNLVHHRFEVRSSESGKLLATLDAHDPRVMQ